MVTILVIEDEENIRINISDALQLEGFGVLEAENGRVGVEMAQTYLPDLIICDVMMPVLDGYQTLLELRSQTVTTNIPFIYLTARTERIDMRHGMELGADDYITKPFSIQELVKTVNTRLKKRANVEEEYEQRLDSLRESIVMHLPHELRTPLFGILGYIELIQSSSDDYDKDEILRMVGVMGRFGNRLQRLVENYLTYAQLEILKADPERINFLQKQCTIMPGAIIKDAAYRQAAAYKREADLETKLIEAEVSVTDDNLNKIATEIIQNAFKFSEAGTPVSVSASVKEPFYIITITDAGRGMNPEDTRRVGAYMQFERKIQEQQGSGLGLAITSRLVDLHRGQINIESTLEAGTTVTIELPLCRE